MVRKRSKTYKQRRFRKYKLKLTPYAVAQRFAQVQEVALMSWGSVVPYMVRVEQKCAELLEQLGVPQEQWHLYMGVAKSAASAAIAHGGTTLITELEALACEYAKRGLDPRVVETMLAVGPTITADAGGEPKAEYVVAGADACDTVQPFFTFCDAAVCDYSYVSILPEEV